MGLALFFADFSSFLLFIVEDQREEEDVLVIFANLRKYKDSKLL
jgi:hypothetical protein